MVRWGIIGAGNVVDNKSGPSLKQAEGCEIAGIYNRDREKAVKVAQKLEIPVVYDNYTAMLSDKSVDAIYIATTPNVHCENALDAIEAGKHVVVEKPLAMNKNEGLKIINAARKKGVKQMTAYYRRFWPGFIKVKELLVKGTIGKPVYMCLYTGINGYPREIDMKNLRWLFKPEISGGGLFVDLGSHRLDMAISYLGNIKKLVAVADKTRPQIPVEEMVGLMGITDDGVYMQAFFFYDTAANVDRLEIIGMDGRMCMELFDGEKIKVTSGNRLEEYVTPKPGGTHADMFEYFAKAVEGFMPESGLDLYTGIEATAVMDAAYASAEKGIWVDVDQEGEIYEKQIFNGINNP